MKISKYANVLCALSGGVIAVTSLSSCESDVGRVNKFQSAVKSKSEMNSLYASEIQKLNQNLKGGGPISGITPGVGYSTDALSIAPTACYNTTDVVRDGQTARLNLDHSVDINTLAQDLSIEFTAKGAYEQFKANAMFNYFSSMAENNYSMSFNFYEKVSRSVNMKYSYSPSTILNEKNGIGLYANGDNPMFRLFCGDTLIKSYDEGAILIMSVQVNFKDKTQKQQVEAELNAGTANDLAGFTSKLTTLNQKYHLRASVRTTGYQLGGEANRLSNMLAPYSAEVSIESKEYYAGAINGLINYAKNDFPNQFSQPSAWTPLGNMKKDLAVNYIGIKLAPTFITSDITNIRNWLIAVNQQNTYNLENLNAVLNGYPVPLDPNYRAQVSSYAQTAKSNLAYSDENSLACWQYPFQCADTYNDISKHWVQLPNKNLINSLYLLSANGLYTGGLFWANQSGPATSVWFNLDLSSVSRTGCYYITSGSGVWPVFKGTAHDCGGTKDQDFDTYIQNNTYMWHNHFYCNHAGCHGEGDGHFPYSPAFITNPYNATLY